MSHINLICKTCKKGFDALPKHKNKIYCSRACYFNDSSLKTGRKKNTDLHEERICVVCDTAFSVRKKVDKKMCSDSCRLLYNKEHKTDRIAKSKEAVLQKHGVTSTLELESVKEKIKDTNLKRYGFEVAAKSDSVKQKTKETTETLDFQKIVEKRKDTKTDRYADANYNNRQKFKTTISSLDQKEILEKRTATMVDRYGVSSSLKLNGVKEKGRLKMIEKYGTDNYTQTEQYKATVRERNVMNFKTRLDFLSFDLITFHTPESCVIRCRQCGTDTHTTQLKNAKQVICRQCNPITSNNRVQQMFELILNEVGVKYQKNNRTIITPFELDYVIPEHKIAFEINGNYYHSQMGGGKDAKYHINKTVNSHEAGYHLIHIFEDELIFKNEIVKSRVHTLLGFSSKIYARKCLIKPVSKSQEIIFLNTNHIQGYAVSSTCLGLFLGEDLVAIMSFVKNRLIGVKEVELLRFCSKLNTTVVGGLSKLLKHYTKTTIVDKIISYADLRWSDYNPDKTAYAKNNFKYVFKTKPNYWYVHKSDYMKREHRLKFRKSELVKKGLDSSKTEKDLMIILGYDFIWDCGSHKFELTPNNVSFDNL